MWEMIFLRSANRRKIRARNLYAARDNGAPAARRGAAAALIRVVKRAMDDCSEPATRLCRLLCYSVYNAVTVVDSVIFCESLYAPRGLNVPGTV